MLTAADVLVTNLATLGSLLVVFLAVWLVLSRIALRAFGALLRRLDGGGELERRLTGQLRRILALLAATVGLALLAGAVLLSQYEIDAAAHLRAWVEGSLLADPAAVAWAAAELVGALLATLALFLTIRALLRTLRELLTRSPTFAGRDETLGRLFERLGATLRSAAIVGAAAIAATLATDSRAILDPLATLAVLILGLSLARTIAAATHLAIDVIFALSGELASRQTPLRYLARLQRIAGVTRRVADYVIYVGAATIVSHQLAPGTLLAQWGQVAIRVIAILYVSRVLVEIIAVLLSDALEGRADQASAIERQQRRTLVPVATSLTRYAIYIFAAAMALSELGLDTTPLFAAAGLMGIAVGLGAQAIVSDLVSGFFILFEGIFLVGHRVQIGDHLGTVEEIGVRVTKIRDEFGVVHAIPNGEIRAVSSYSQRYVNAVVDFSVPHEEDLARVFVAIKARLDGARAATPDILGESEIAVEELRESSILIRTTTPVAPGEDEPLCDLIRFEIAAALAAAGIRPPHAYRVLRSAPEIPPARESA